MEWFPELVEDDSFSSLGPTVAAPQPKNEHLYPALFANSVLTGIKKSSSLPICVYKLPPTCKSLKQTFLKPPKIGCIYEG